MFGFLVSWVASQLPTHVSSQ